MIEWENCPTNGGMSPFSLEARDEDYDTYLFWPSLSNGMGASKESFVATYHTSTSPLPDQVDYYSGWDTAPSSPLSLTSPSEFHFPTPCGNKSLENGLPEGRSGWGSSLYGRRDMLIVRFKVLGSHFGRTKRKDEPSKRRILATALQYIRTDFW